MAEDGAGETGFFDHFRENPEQLVGWMGVLLLARGCKPQPCRTVLQLGLWSLH